MHTFFNPYLLITGLIVEGAIKASKKRKSYYFELRIVLLKNLYLCRSETTQNKQWNVLSSTLCLW